MVKNLPCPFLLGLPFMQSNRLLLDTSDLSFRWKSRTFGTRTTGPSSKDKRALWAGSKDNPIGPVNLIADVILLPGFVHRVPLNLPHGKENPRYFVGDDIREDKIGYVSVAGILDVGESPYVLKTNLTPGPLFLEAPKPVGSITSIRSKQVYIVATSPMTADDTRSSLNEEINREHRICSVSVDNEDFNLEEPPLYLPSKDGIGYIRPEDEGKEVTLEILEKMLDPSMPEPHRSKMLSTMLKMRDIWTNSFSAQWDCGEYEMTLKPGASPYKARSFRFPHAQMEPLRVLIDKRLQEGVIVPSNSPWCSSAFFVPKPHGGGLRFVVDYRVLNANTVEDRFPLPEIQDIFNNFQGHSVFSTFDALSGFNQQSVAMNSRDYTSFVCQLGTFRSTRLSMGLRNGPASFQRGMLLMCHGLKGVNVYIDDFSVSNGNHWEGPGSGNLNDKGETKDEYDIHHDLVTAFLTRCLHHGLRLNPKICLIGARSVKYLGYIISNEGLKPDPEKVACHIISTCHTRLSFLRQENCKKHEAC